MEDKNVVERALLESDREKVSFPYRLVMIRQQAHEAAGRYKEANECASIRHCLELAHKMQGLPN